MSGVPLGPQHLSHQALLGPLPPRGMEADTWQDAYDAVDTMLATNFSNPNKQASLFEQTAKTIIRMVPSVESFARHAETIKFISAFLNKYSQFAKRRSGRTPQVIQSVFDLQTTMRGTAASQIQRQNQQIEADRSERVAALEESQTTKGRKRSHKVSSSKATVDTSDEDSEEEVQITLRDEDDPMEEAPPLKNVADSGSNAHLSFDKSGSAPTGSVEDPIDGDEFMKEIDEVIGSKAGKGKQSPSKPKATRPEAVRIPYIRASKRIDVESNSYIKAMAIVEKTNPKEANKVLDEIPPPPPRKRQRSGSFYEFEEAHSGLQVVNMTQKQLDKLTPKQSNQIVENSLRAVVAQAKVSTPDDAIRQERHVRAHMANATSQLQHFLKVREHLVGQHKRLLSQMEERKLKPLNGGSFELDDYMRCTTTNHEHKSCSHGN
ncbi:hypothetical protein B0H11DRAFT_2246558 [Mycena galericulata]|nr:hypothetical protein B0H11DRAFT_2246558 [Mycena galericulata]